MQTTPKANTILGYFFALLGAVVMLAIATWVIASSSQQVQQLTNPMAVPRTGHAATVLSDGRVLITGGHDSAGNLVAVSEIFDPAAGTSTASATLTTARVNHTATLLADGRVLVAGGSDANGAALSSAEIFDPANAGAGFQAVQSAMTAARTGHTATLLNNGTVLIAGGEATGTAEVFDPTTSTFTATTVNLTTARSGHTATLFTDDSVLLAGGGTDSMETFTPTDQKFTLDAATMSVVRTGHWALELSDTRLLLFQGDTNNTIDEYNPTAGTITPKGSLDFHATSSTLLANGKVLVLGSGVAGLYDPDAVPPAADFTAFDETSVPGSTALQRSGQSATQLSGDKKIYVAGGVDNNNLSMGQALFNPARIWSDKDDYQPGDNVILSGSGWKANESVYLYAVDDTTEAWTYGTTVTADATGGFVVNPLFVVQLVQLGANFHVTAVGAQSAMQADVKFTDSSNLNTATVTTKESTCTTVTTAFTQGQSVCGSVNVTGISGNGAGTFFIVWFNPSNGIDHATSEAIPGSIPGVVTDTFNTTGKPAGTWSVHACKNNTCSGGNDVASATFTLAGTASKYVVTSSNNNPVAGTAVTITAQLSDAGGNPVPTAGKTVTWSKNLPSGSFGSPTSTTDANGKATVSFTTGTTAGTVYTVTATDNTALTGTSGNITTQSGAATQLALSGSTADLASGSTRVLTATIQDTNGNPVTTGADSTLSVTFAKTSGTGTVTGLGSSPASGGIATITVTGNAAGPITITASATGSGGALTAGTGNPITFNVVGGTATRLVITGSATQTAGTSQNLTITAKDAVGNTVTSYTGPKSLTFSGANPSTNPVTQPTVTNSSGIATNFGSATAITFTNGAATVSISSNGAMKLFRAETAIIAANDGAGAVSAGADRLTVTVSAGTLNQFALSLTSPQNNGATFTGTNTLTAQDTWGNTVTGFNAATDHVTIVANAPLVGTVSGLGSAGVNALDQAGNFVSGVANLTGLMRYTGSLGTGTFTAISSTFKTGTSGNVTINVGGLDHFKVEAAGGGVIGTQTQNVAFNIMITAQDAGNNTVTSFSGTGAAGTVMLTSTGTLLGGPSIQTTAFSNGVLSSFSVTITNSGTFTITAAGFGGNAGKTGTSNSFLVNPGTVNTSTSVASSLNPSVYGQSVTFTATVTAASGSNPPTGSVNFVIAGIGTVAGTPGTTTSTTATWTYTTSALDVPGSPHSVSANYVHTGNFVDSNGSLSGSQTVNKATPTATLSVTNSPATFNGSPQAATVSISASSVPGAVANVKYNGSGTVPTNVATYTVTADFVPTDTANYNTLTNQSAGNFEIQKATPTATLTVTNSSVTYNGSPQSATIAISGNSAPGTVANVKYNGSSTVPTNAATYAVTADFVPTDTANYNTLTDQSAGSFVIQKATPTATLTVTNSPVNYSGLPQAATIGITSPVAGSVANVKYNGSSTVPTNAATYAVTADFVPTDTANYNTLTNQSAGNFVIDKANATVTVTPYTCPTTTYNGLSHTATYSITGVNGETGATVGSVDVTDTIHTHANIYNGDQWTFTGTANYKDQSGTVDDCISPVTLTASIIGDPTRPYNGNTTATLTSANFSLSGLVGTENFTVNQTVGAYNSKDVLTANTVTANLAAGDFTPGAGTLASDYVLPTTASGTGHISPLALTASIINDPTRPYNGNTDATLVPGNFKLTPQVGSESFTVTQTVGAYNSKDVLAANTVSASLAAGDFTPTSGAVASNYTLPTTASGPGHITPKTGVTASIIGNPTRPYNCGTVAALTSANFQLSGLVGTENFTVNQTVGAYNSKDVVSANTVTASLSTGDFTGTNGGIASNYVLPTTASGAGHITPATATFSVTGYHVTYNCNAHTLTATTGMATGVCSDDLGAGLNFSGTTHTSANNGVPYNDTWTFHDAAGNYNDASGNVTDQIDKADPTISVMPYTVTYNCNAHTATGTATGCDGNLLSLGDTLDLSGTTHTNANDYASDSWTFTDVTGNYNNKSGTVHDVINKADTTSSVTSNVNPSIIGQNVTFTATVAGNPAVTCNPTGTVTFKDGTTTLMAGVALSGGSATLSTSSLSAGGHSITAVYSGDGNFNATGVGSSTATSYTQNVHYNFIGFLPPVDNPPIVNSTKAGQVIPVKWQLTDYNGNLIGDLGTLSGMGSLQIACVGGLPVDAIDQLAAPGATVFRFDGTQFIYNWQTSKPWGGTCRQLQVTLTDGTTHIANFTFK